ncbi:MAG: hypothetical protein KGR42_00410 [Acidobacteria bacterium]|nr:hypothetical protein [Acidobacteriota bacterium]
MNTELSEDTSTSARSQFLLRATQISRGVLLASLGALLVRIGAGPASGLSNFPGHSTDILYLVVWIALAFWGLLEAIHLMLVPVSDATQRNDDTNIEPPSPEQRRFRLVLTGTVLTLLVVTFHSALETFLMTYGDAPTLGPTHYIASAFPMPSSWTFGQFGGFSVINIRVVIPVMLSTVFAKVGISYAISKRLIMVLPFLALIVFGVRSLFRRLGTHSSLTVLAVAFFLLNYSILDWYAGGWFPILIAFALIPLVISLFFAWIDAPTTRGAFFLGLTGGVLTLIDLRDAVILLIVALPLILASVGRGDIRRRLWSELGKLRAGTIVIGLIAFTLVILPQLVAIQINSSQHLNGMILPTSYYDVSNLTKFSFYSLADTMSLFNPWWPYFHFFDTSMLQSVPVINVWPILIVVASIFMRSISLRIRVARVIGLFAYLLGSAFASGADSPFKGLNTFLWNHLPGFNLFRNPELWMQLALLGVLLILPSLTPLFRVATFSGLFRRHGAEWSSFRWAGTIVAVLLTGVLVQGLMVATEVVQHPVSNLSAHTSIYTTRVQNYLDQRPGSVLWVPTPPAIAYGHLISSAHLNGVTLNSWFSVADFPNLTSGQVASGGPIYPELFSSRSTAWSLINQYRIGYLVVDRMSGPWSLIGSSNLDTTVESTLRSLGMTLEAQNADYAIFRANPTPIVETSTLGATLPPSGDPPHSTTFSPSSFKVAQHVIPSTGVLNFPGGYAERMRCVGTTTPCVVVSAAGPLTTLATPARPFTLVPGDRVQVSTALNNAGAAGGITQVAIGCQGVPVSLGTVPVSDGLKFTQFDFEYTGSSILSSCSATVNLLNYSPQTYPPRPNRLEVAVVQLRVMPPLSPRTTSLSRDVTITNQTHATTPLSSRISDRAQDSWTVQFARSERPRVVELWQTFSPGWVLDCPTGSGRVTPALLNGWAMSFRIPPGGGISCTLNFPAQTTIGVSIWVSLGGLVILFAFSLVPSRRIKSRRVMSL